MRIKISENIIKVRHVGVPNSLNSSWSLEDYSMLKQGHKIAALLCGVGL
jgi:hypothetical protein